MRAVFLGHSGFLVELPSVTLLFDWWKGALPPLRPGIPLLVFASHRHEDHFSPQIFSLNAHAFLLGCDFQLSPRSRQAWGLSEETAAQCVCLGEQVRFSPLPDVTVETLPSTDEGAAFLVSADGQTVFHAGDLNWWHWAGEDPDWNRTMAARFLRYTEPLRNRRLDLAMLPLDPRLGEDAFRGPKHILESADVRCFLPMHQWGDFGFTRTFLAQYPQFRSQTIPVTHDMQTVSFGTALP